MINLILFCFGTASLTLFLDMCMEKGMIFRKYYNWITYWFYLPNNKLRSYKVSLPGLNVLYAYPRFVKNEYTWLWKVLGGCNRCFGSWLFICTYLVTIILETSVFTYNSFILAVYGILGIGFNYVFIKAIEKL
jgi:hypothetical protein